MLILCLAYSVAMAALIGFLISQRQWTQVAAMSAATVAPLTVSATLFAAIRREALVALAPHHKRLLLAMMLLGGALLGAGMAGALLLLT